MTASLSVLDGTDFEISEQEILGRGVLGPLYRGRQRSSGREAAIRALTPAAPSRAGALVAQLREHAKHLATLESPGIVPILGTGLWGERVFYAMEHVGGESLAECIVQAHRFTTDEILHVAEGIAGTLKDAARGNLSPCGIKPGNIFLTPGGAVRIAELGLGAATAESTGISIVRAQGRYVSPELIYGDSPDIRSDLYSLGVILYELATRTLPFEGYDSTTSFHYQLLHVEPAAPRELGSFIPRELERVVMRCLAKAPSDRYQNPDELLEDLQAARRQQGSSPAMPGVPPDEPGDFDIYEDQVIGEGGMGILYRARQHSLGRPVAVKVIRDAFTATPSFLQRFRQEAELLAQVNHPNVVQVFGTGTWRGRLFYAMELVEGKDVASRLRDAHHFNPLEVLHIAEGVAKALAAAWKFRIVHRDIKPSNILVTADGVVKVADFGLAKSLRIRKSDSRLIAGTAEYISPEQGMGLAVDIRSDIYSLGVVLYELLLGRPPFKSDGSFTFVVYQHVHSSPPSLGGEPGNVPIPAPLRKLIQKCLEKKPEDRFQRPEDMLLAIQKAREELEPQLLPGGSFPPTPTPTQRLVPTPAARWRGRLPNAALLGIMMAGTLVAILAVVRHQISSAQPKGDAAQIELLLGLGDYRAALDLARSRWGPKSSEYHAVLAREREHRTEERERAVREAVLEHDWLRATPLLEEAAKDAPPDRQRELRRALAVSRNLLRAQGLDQEGRTQEAIDLYRRTAEEVPTLAVYCCEAIDRLGSKLPAAPPK